MSDRLYKISVEANGIAVMAVPGNRTASLLRLLEAFQRQFHALAADDSVKGIIVTDAGSRFFDCSVDRAMLPGAAASLSACGQQIMFGLEKTGKPVIAALSGECSGPGFEVALACNFIMASDSATFGFPAICDGMIPLCGGTQRLPRLIGTSKAKEMIFSGVMITAAEALRIRLINRLCAPADLLPQAMELMARICRHSPRAIRVGAEVVNAGYDIDLQTACLLERNAFALCFSSLDQREGMQSFRDKRQPRFTGE